MFSGCAAISPWWSQQHGSKRGREQTAKASKGDAALSTRCAHSPQGTKYQVHTVGIPSTCSPLAQRNRNITLARSHCVSWTPGAAPRVRQKCCLSSARQAGAARGVLPPTAAHYLPHLFRDPWKKNGVRKIPLAPFYPPLFCPRPGRDQRNVDSPSAAVRGAARGLLYGQEQMAVAQVDPPTTPY